MKESKEGIAAFDHEKFGFKITESHPSDSDGERLSSLVLRLKKMAPLSDGQIEIAKGISAEDNIRLLKELRRSCMRAIHELESGGDEIEESK